MFISKKIFSSSFFSKMDKLKILREMILLEQKRRKINREMKKRNPKTEFFPDAFADSDCTFEGSVVLSTNVKVMNCRIGANTYIAVNSRLFNCDVGNYCSIGPELLAGLGMHPTTEFVSTHPSFYSPQNASPISHVSDRKFQESKRIMIGNDVWIGARVTIVDGVIINDGAIIAAGAVVTHDVEPYSIVGGVPAKEIRKRFEKEEIDFLLNFRWWEKEDEWIRKNASSFCNIQEFMRNIEG